MTLEDHIGDILRKGRLAAGVPAPALAAAAGLAPDELARLEQTGQSPRPLPFDRLGPLLDLDGPCLEAIATGWTPRPPDLAQWPGLSVLTTSQEGNAVHAWLLDTGDPAGAVLFDTGWNTAPVFERLAGRPLAHLCITHSHGDHIAVLAPLRAAFPQAKLHTGPAQTAFLPFAPGPSPIQITPIPVTGHAPDGVVYLIEHWPAGAPPAVILGDTLFAGSMAGGFVSWTRLRQQTQALLDRLPSGALLCPGHGPLTTVSEERAHNPFFARRPR